MKTEIVELPSVVGKGYKDFWEFRGRYRVCKGSRASKKSKTTALWYISHIMMYTGTFTDSNLSSGILTINHSWGEVPMSYIVLDENGDAVIPRNVRYNNNQVLIDLSIFTPISGTWKYTIGTNIL